MDGKELGEGLGTLVTTVYQIKERKEILAGQTFTNLYVKNFPSNKFTDQDLRVSYLFN